MAKKDSSTGKKQKKSDKSTTDPAEKRLKRLEKRLEAAVVSAEDAAKQANKAAKRLSRHAKELATKPIEQGAAVIPSRFRTGEPLPVEDLESKTRAELLELAREADVTGRSSMTKAELVAALRG